MLTQRGAALLGLSGSLLVLAIPNANTVLLALAAMPLIFLMFAAYDAAPRRVHIERRLPEGHWLAGAQVSVEVRYRVEGGRGIVEFHQGLPEAFEVVEGSNLHVFHKWRGTTEGTFRFVVRCPKRGRHVLPPLDWHIVASLGMARGRSGTAGDGVEVRVQVPTVGLRRVPNIRGQAVRIFPDADVGRVGLATHEFRELRVYMRGDSPRDINWKATARAQSRMPPPGSVPGHPAAAPWVNDHEVEGRKRVWVFLDAGPAMAVGTNLENAFEAAVEAAVAAARFFADRGYRVGFTLFNHPGAALLYPDTGARQVLRIRDLLHGIEPSHATGGLPEAVRAARPHLRGGRALALIVTRVEAADEATIDGLRMLRSRTRRRRAPVLVVSPDPYGLVPSGGEGMDAARATMRLLDREPRRAARALGVEVLSWDPRRTRIHAVLARRVAAR